MTAWLLSLGETIQTPAVDHEKIEPAVVVIVVKRKPAACGFQKVLILALRAVRRCDGEAGLLCDVDEADAEWRTFDRRLRARGRRCGFCVVTALLRTDTFLRRLRLLLQR